MGSWFSVVPPLRANWPKLALFIKCVKKEYGLKQFFTFFGVFKHDKLEQLLSQSFKQKFKLNPVSRARQRGKKRYKSSVKSIVCQFAAFQTKGELMVRTLKIIRIGVWAGGGGSFCNILSKLQYIEVVRLEFSRSGGVKKQKHDCKVEEHIQICTQIYNI